MADSVMRVPFRVYMCVFFLRRVRSPLDLMVVGVAWNSVGKPFSRVLSSLLLVPRDQAIIFVSMPHIFLISSSGSLYQDSFSEHLLSFSPEGMIMSVIMHTFSLQYLRQCLVC